MSTENFFSHYRGRAFTFELDPMKFSWTIVFFQTVSSVLVGRIDNSTYVANDAPLLSFMSSSCSACLCRALTFYDVTFVLLKCFDNGRACDIFSRNSNMLELQSRSNSTLFFYPNLPPKNPTAGEFSEILNAILMTNFSFVISQWNFVSLEFNWCHHCWNEQWHGRERIKSIGIPVCVGLWYQLLAIHHRFTQQSCSEVRYWNKLWHDRSWLSDRHGRCYRWGSAFSRWDRVGLCR